MGSGRGALQAGQGAFHELKREPANPEGILSFSRSSPFQTPPVGDPELFLELFPTGKKLRAGSDHPPFCLGGLFPPWVSWGGCLRAQPPNVLRCPAGSLSPISLCGSVGQFRE